MKVKIEYEPERLCCYIVYVKTGVFGRWIYRNSFDELKAAKQCAKELFTKRIYAAIYKDETDIK